MHAALPIHRLDLGPLLNTGGVSGLGEGSGRIKYPAWTLIWDQLQLAVALTEPR